MIVLFIVFLFFQLIVTQDQNYQLVINKNCTDIELYRITQSDKSGEVPINALFYSEMQSLINNQVNMDKNIRIDDCEVQNQSLQQLKYIVFYYEGQNQKIFIDNKEENWFVFQKYLILVAKDFDKIIQEGSIINIYNPYTESFQEILVTRKNAQNIQNDQIPPQKETHQQKDVINQDKQKSNIKKAQNLNIKNKLTNYNSLIDLPKDGGYHLYISQEQQDKPSEIEELSLRENNIQEEEKIYNYYFPSMSLEQGIIPKDAIREKLIVQNQMIRKIFPQEAQNWTLFFFIKSSYHSIQGQPIFIPFYIKDVNTEQNQNMDYDKIQIRKEFIQKIVNIEKVDKNTVDIILRKQYLDPPFQFMDQFITYENFEGQINELGIKIFLKSQQLMYFDQISKNNQSVQEVLNNCFLKEITNSDSNLEELKICANLCVGSLMLKLEKEQKLDQKLYKSCQQIIQKTKPMLLRQYNLNESDIPSVAQFKNFRNNINYDKAEKEK